MEITSKAFAEALYREVYRERWGEVFTVEMLIDAILLKGKYVEVYVGNNKVKLFSWEIYKTLKHIVDTKVIKEYYDTFDFLNKLALQEDMSFVFRNSRLY